MRRILIGVVLTALFSVGAVTAGAVTTTPTNAKTRGVVLLVGDSNINVGAEAIERTLTQPDNGYVPIFAARNGAKIRTPDCPDELTCTTFDYWKTKLAGLTSKIKADVIVNDLGINDTIVPGTETTPGYLFYGRKIDWFMNLVGGKPVLWTTLPCAIEPSSRQTGCKTVNFELYRALDRWPNLTVLAWAAEADQHPTYLPPTGDVHYTPAGQWAWARFVQAALDARLAAP